MSNPINFRRRIILVSLCPLESNEVCIVGDYISQPPSHSQKNYNFSFEYNFEKCLSTCKGYWQYGAAKLRKVGSVKNIFLFLPNLFRLLFNSHILPSLLFLLCELQRIHNLQQNTATPQKCSLDGELPVLLLRVSGTSTMLKLQKRKKVLMNNFSNILHHRKKGAKGGGKLKEKENASSAYFRCVTSLTPEVQILKRDVFRFDI